MKSKFLLLSCLMFLNSCVTYIPEKEQVVPCPKMSVEETTSIGKFYTGDKEDDDSLLYTIELLGYNGTCEYSSNYKSVKILMNPTFNIETGKNFKDNKVKIDYFIAVPKMFPDPDGRTLLTTKPKVPKGLVKFNFTDDVVEVKVPIEDGENPSNFKIFIGLQLTIDQLKNNKSY